MPSRPQDYRGDARSEVLALLAQMHQAAKDPARVHQITDQIEVFAMAHLEPSASDPLPVVTMSKLERRLFMRLHKANGAVIHPERLMNALYFDKVGDEPHIKIVDVYVWKVRNRLRGTRYSIKNLHGQGYRLAEATC